MSYLNLNYGVLIYSDPNQKAPQVRDGGDISKAYIGVHVSRSEVRQITLQPGETQTIASTLRANGLDTTTQLSLLYPISTQGIFRIQWTGTGTAPSFRTKRALGQDATTAITILRISPNSMRMQVVAGTAIATSSVQVGDLIRFERSTDTFTSPLSASNAGRTWVVQSKGSNYIDFIDNQASVEEPIPVVLGTDFDSVVRVFSTGSVRVGDTVRIQGSTFNASNKGDFVIADMAHDYIEIVNSYGVAETALNTDNLIKIYDHMIGFAHILSTAPVTLMVNGTSPVDLVMLTPSDAVFLGSINAYQVDAINKTQDAVIVTVQLAAIGS